MKKGAWVVVGLVVVMSAFFSSFVQADTIPAQLNVGNGGLALVQNIPHQRWAMNTNLENVFDMDDYFQSVPGASITYSVSGNSSISIIMDSVTHLVTLMPALNFVGEEYVVFTATDGSNNVSSNTVNLSVVNDTVAPWWSSASSSPYYVYQSSMVNFSTVWEDDVRLLGYILSLNDGGGWRNITGNFTGLVNTSFLSVQMAYPPGTVVYWRYYGYDSVGNMNQTLTYNFTIVARPEPPSGPAGGGLTQVSQMFANILRGGEKEAEKVRNFSVEPASFRVRLKQEETKTVFLKISNTGNLGLNISLEAIDIPGMLVISEKQLALGPGETKSIAIDVVAKKVLPDLYFGKLRVSTESEYVDLPFVVQVDPLEIVLALGVKVPEEYKFVKPGNKVGAEIIVRSVADLRDVEAVLILAVKSMDGVIIDSSRESVVFQREIVLNRSFTIPKDTALGEYFFYGRVEYNSSVNIGVDSFFVGTRLRYASMARRILLIFYLILVMIIFILLVMRYRRNKKISKVLQLYLLVNELKGYLEKGDYEKALQIYVKIKAMYGEKKIHRTLQNKEELKLEMQGLIKKFEMQGKNAVVEEKKDETKGDETKGAGGEKDAGKEKKEGEKDSAAGKDEGKKGESVLSGEGKKEEVKEGEKKNDPGSGGEKK